VKRITFLVMVALFLLAPMPGAWARGDGWEPLELPDHIVTSCGDTRIDVTFPVNNSYQRVTTLSDGTVITQVTGRLVVTFAVRGDDSLTLNISGPQRMTEYPNGDVEFQSYGLNGGPPLVPDGMPDLVWTAGPADIIVHPDGSVTVIQLPPHLVDVCAALGV
jgi:hypothetical protein